MQFIKRNIWTLAAMVLFVTVAMVGDAAAVDGTSLMTQASKKVSNVFEAVRTIIFILGGFGLVGVAFAAIFGKVNWKWFAALAVVWLFWLLRTPSFSMLPVPKPVRA